MKLPEILSLADTAHFASIASICETGSPQATTVEFGIWNDKIVFDTFIKSRKFENITNNNHVALVMMPNIDASIDIEGRAEILSGDDLIKAQKAYFAKIPQARQWANQPNVAFFAVTIDWARLTDVDKKPWQIEIYKSDS